MSILSESERSFLTALIRENADCVAGSATLALREHDLMCRDLSTMTEVMVKYWLEQNQWPPPKPEEEIVFPWSNKEEALERETQCRSGQ